MRQKIWTGLLFGFFLVSFVLLAIHIFPEWQVFLTGQPTAKVVSRIGRYEKMAEVPLGKVEIRGVRTDGVYTRVGEDCAGRGPDSGRNGNRRGSDAGYAGEAVVEQTDRIG